MNIRRFVVPFTAAGNIVIHAALEKSLSADGPAQCAMRPPTLTRDGGLRVTSLRAVSGWGRPGRGVVEVDADDGKAGAEQ
ncbi:MAG: hypothetical protein U0531_06940 [Dehalococcoidia bacterium]